MNLLIIGGVAGGIAGALGYFLAGKIHGNKKGMEYYPLYSASFFGLAIFAAKYIAL